MKLHLLFSVIWLCLASVCGVIYLNKPHVTFLVAGSIACLLALTNLAMHVSSSPKKPND